jgi:hypothetical protein
VATTSGESGVSAEFPRAVVEVGGEPWRVAVADTPQRRSRGLMGVTGLGGLDGMLFVWVDDVDGAFWMKDTLIPLDIAFFDSGGGLVDSLAMVPCEEDPCPRYRAAGSYRYALEVPAGGFEGIDPLTLVP